MAGMTLKTVMMVAVLMTTHAPVMNALTCISNYEQPFQIVSCPPDSKCLKATAGSSVFLGCAPKMTCTFANGVSLAAKIGSKIMGDESGGFLNSVVEAVSDEENVSVKCCDSDLCNNRIWFGVNILFIVVPLALILLIGCCACICKCCQAICCCCCREKPKQQQLPFTIHNVLPVQSNSNDYNRLIESETA